MISEVVSEVPSEYPSTHKYTDPPAVAHPASLPRVAAKYTFRYLVY